MADQDDFEDFEEFEEKPVKGSKKKTSKTKPTQSGNSKVIVEEPLVQSSSNIDKGEVNVSNQDLEKLKEKLYGKKDKEEGEKEVLNIERIGPGSYRLSSLYFASSREYFNNVSNFIDFYDGSVQIRDFERNCSLTQMKAKQLKEMAELNEKDKQKRIFKDKKKDLTEIDKVKEDSMDDKYDTRRDLNSENPYPNIKQTLEESNPLNGNEFYEDLYKTFCNQLDQNTKYTDVVEKLDLPERKEPEKKNDGRHASVRKMSHMITPNNQDAMKSSPNMSPRSSHPTDNYFSFNESMSKHRQSAFFLSREDSDKTFFRVEERKEPQVDATERKALLESEKKILKDFIHMLKAREKYGKLPFAASTLLNKNTATSVNNIFRYDSLSYHEELVENSTINKRIEKEVNLDYDAVDLARPGSLLRPVKKLKQRGPTESNYSNADLVYSTWYDTVLSRINDEPDHELKKHLLIDMNDKNVFYSKLVSILSDSQNPEEPQSNMPDLGFSNMPNSKLLEKYMNKAKKAVRIKIAKTKGGNEMEERGNDEMINEEDLKMINLLNQPNANANSVFGAKGMGLNKISSKKVRKITNYNHSDVANNFQFNIFRMSKDKIKSLHRFDISRVVYGDIISNRNNKWRVKVLNNSDKNYPLRKQLNRKSKIISNINSQEIHHSHEIFKKFSKLSLKTDDFFLFEYIEKSPLVLGNIGMASRLTKYYYPVKIIKKIVDDQGAEGDEKDKIGQFKHYLKDKMGEHGEEYPLEETEQLPLLGQLIGNKYEGVAILENNLYRVPVFKQKTKKNDFILVRVIEKGEVKYYLRKIKTIYTAGQIQPKSEVFCPYSRQFRFFLKKLLKFLINRCFEEKRTVHLRELKEFFPTMNDHNLRKNIKMLGGEQDPNDNKFYIFNQQLLQENKINDYADEIEASIIPEELCLYERMYQTYYDLLDFGIQKLKSSDKISVIKTKFYRNNLDYPEKCAISRRIIQELMLTSWNLSQSFISAIQTQGRMYLTGYGDATNGHGGMNFIKLPLKISRYESQLFRKAKKGKTNQMVTGTDADLRRLPMTFVHETLKKHGFTEDTLANLERWDKIELLRDISNKYQGDTRMDDLDKFKREIRMTTKMQKEKYQNDINELLMNLIKNLTVQGWDDIDSEDEGDTLENMNELISAEEKEINKYRNLRSDDEDDDHSSSNGTSNDNDNDDDDDDDDQSKNTQEIDATKIIF